MQNVARILGTALTASLVLLGTACDKKPTEATPGEKLDSAIAEAKQAGQEAGQAVDNAGANLGQKLDQAGQVLDDSAITASVKAKLLAADDLKGLTIEVDTKQGVVSLSGPVKSAAARDRALALARETDGVKDVSDHLRIQ